MSAPSICCIIPTYNEEDLLRQSVQSLVDEKVPGLHILVINAGKPLSGDIKANVEEVNVPSDFFWTHCIGKGFEVVRERKTYDLVMMANADTVVIPGTMALLIDMAQKPDVVACAPGYMRYPDGKTELLYSSETFYPVLFHFRLKQDWKSVEDAPSEPYEVPMTGGQAVMFSAKFLDKYDVDPILFPQGKGDHDLWLAMRRGGIKLMMVPKAGAINMRAFGEMARTERKKRLKKLWPRATTQQSNDSWRVMWAMRKKYMPLPMAIVSFGIMFPWRQFKGLVDAVK